MNRLSPLLLLASLAACGQPSAQAAPGERIEAAVAHSERELARAEAQAAPRP